MNPALQNSVARHRWISMGLLATLGGCEAEAADRPRTRPFQTPCNNAKAYVVDCLGFEPDGLFDQCDPELADELVAASCGELSAACGDTRIIRTDLSRDAACAFNFQCNDDRVCRPRLHRCEGPVCGSRRVCTGRGSTRQFCDADRDCVGGVCFGEEVNASRRCLSFEGGRRQAICASLRYRFADCGLPTKNTVISSCHTSDRFAQAFEVHDWSCRWLAAAVEQGLDLTDAPLQLNLPRKHSCWFNFQCGEDAVCRPAHPTCRKPPCVKNQICQGAGQDGSPCDSHSDCFDGLRCLGAGFWPVGFCGRDGTSAGGPEAGPH